MPTFNQLVRKGREVLVTKSTAPALQKTYNSQKTVSYTHLPAGKEAPADRDGIRDRFT